MAYQKNDQTYPTVHVMKTQHDYWQESHDQVLAEMRSVAGYGAVPPGTLPMNNITCMAGGDEMLRVGPDGFWVRGVRVEQDDKEAQAVYNAFKAWMSWAQLNRDYK
jgi:hypothetical protein